MKEEEYTLLKDKTHIESALYHLRSLMVNDKKDSIIIFRIIAKLHDLESKIYNRIEIDNRDKLEDL